MHLSFSKLALFASAPLAAGKNVVRRAKVIKEEPTIFDAADRMWCSFERENKQLNDSSNTVTLLILYH